MNISNLDMATMKTDTAMGCNLRASGAVDALDGKWIEVKKGEQVNIIAVSLTGKSYLVGKRIGTNEFFAWLPCGFVEKIDK